MGQKSSKIQFQSPWIFPPLTPSRRGRALCGLAVHLGTHATVGGQGDHQEQGSANGDWENHGKSQWKVMAKNGESWDFTRFIHRWWYSLIFMTGLSSNNGDLSINHRDSIKMVVYIGILYNGYLTGIYQMLRTGFVHAWMVWWLAAESPSVLAKDRHVRVIA